MLIRHRQRSTALLRAAENISEIIQNQLPDENGNTIPTTVHEGSAEIAGAQAEHEHILIGMAAGTYNVRKATCSYYCISCDGYIDYAFGVAPFAVKIGGTSQLNVTARWDGGTQYNLNGSATWTSSKTGIATVTTGLVKGVARGSTTVSGWAYENLEYDYCAYDPTSCPGDNENMGGSGTGNIGPYQVEPIDTASQGPAACSIKGQAGWIRNVTNQVQQVDGSAYAVSGLTAADQITTTTPNQLGITGTQTGSFATTGDGSFPDSYYVCSAYCPGSGETGALQNWTVAGIPLFHVDAVVYKCGSISIDGR